MNSGTLTAGLTFEEVVRKYADTVTGVCIMRLQNEADAEDCFQNTFVKLYTKSPQFTSEEHLKAWLIRVAIRECADYRRKNRRDLSLEHCRDIGVDFNYDASDMSWALSKIPVKFRDALYLYYCERYSVNEIAEIIGKKPSTVKTLLKRGRERLKKIYGGDE